MLDHAPLPSEEGTPRMIAIMIQIAHDLLRDRRNLSIIADTIASMIETELVSAANKTSAKNKNPISSPLGIWSNTLGSVINIRPAPLDLSPASPLNIYTAGMIRSPARRDIIVSNISIWLTDLERLISSFVYEP